LLCDECANEKGKDELQAVADTG